jgi:hypothetical protein
VTTLNSQVDALPLPTVDFSWDPIGAAITFNLAGNSYPPVGPRFEAFYTPINELVTFTADATPASGTEIIQYRWDMGDGIVQYGQTVGHIYGVPNPSMAVKLEVMDGLGRKAYVSKVLLLQFEYATVVSGKIRVGTQATELLASTSLPASGPLVAEGI